VALLEMAKSVPKQTDEKSRCIGFAREILRNTYPEAKASELPEIIAELLCELQVDDLFKDTREEASRNLSTSSAEPEEPPKPAPAPGT
jgi:hypothetical protein